MTATNTFAEFVSVLSAYLDDHELRGDDLAARLHLSRSHFDRIISAVAGEAPGRFRRRILLERAAFLLRTSQLSVLEVAVEAGYSSHEAFTRAFQRAYGAPPSAWRTSSASLHLPAPNGVHFYPPGGLRLPTREQASAMPFAAALIDHHVHVLSQLLDRVDGLSDDQLDSPVRLPSPGIDDDPTVRSLMSRLIGQMDMWNRAVANQPYDFAVERDEPVSSMRARLASAGAAFAAYVREATEHERLDEAFVDATCDEPFMFTAAGMIGHVLTYAAYRRTAVVCTLSALGVADVEDDPLTWFAPGRP